MEANQRQFRNIAYLSDVTGTGFWRHIQQMLAANSTSQHLGIFNTYTQVPVLDQNYYRDMASVTVQRWISDQQCRLFNDFLKPVCDAYGTWLIYGIDDAMHYEDIPLWNRGRHSFANDQIQSNIKRMLNAADLVIVTTKHLKQYYNARYGVPMQNLLAVPNLLPRWWFGDKFSLQEVLDNRNTNKAKPRVGIVSSLSHYNFSGYKKTASGEVAQFDAKTKKWMLLGGGEVDASKLEVIHDDIDEIADVVEKTVNDFTWVFFGTCPARFKKLLEQKKIESYGTTAILNYPNMLKRLKLQAIVAPLVKCEFNFCKSPIKYLESCAIGVPLLATRCKPYEGVMDDRWLFSDAAELEQKLRLLKFASTGAYKDIVLQNFSWLNSPHEDGDFSVSNCWLDDNMHIWYGLFRLRKKAMLVSYSRFKQQHEARQAAMPKEVLHSRNGVEILR